MRCSAKLPVVAAVICLASFSLSPAAGAEDANELPDRASRVSSTPQPDEPYERVTSWHRLPKDFLHDQTAIWLFPVSLARGRHWVPTVAITGLTAGLIVADPHVMPYFRSHQPNLDDANDTFNAYLTTGEVIAVPASLMLAGYIRHDDYQVDTALLAGEAYADTAIVDLAINSGNSPGKTV